MSEKSFITFTTGNLSLSSWCLHSEAGLYGEKCYHHRCLTNIKGKSRLMIDKGTTGKDYKFQYSVSNNDLDNQL
jgi:hypothetical protein